MSTAIMPVDPATTPQHANRVLGIRASLLPAEITAGRNARRVKFSIVGAVVLVALLMGGWYGVAVHQKALADADNAKISTKISAARREGVGYSKVTTVIKKNEEMTKNLKAALADDLRWSTLLDTIQSVGTSLKINITAINGQLSDKAKSTGAASTALPSTKSAASVLELTITGTAPDKDMVAAYIDALGKQKTIANALLTAATESQTEDVTFSMTAEVTSDALCGRYTTSCTTGGK